MVISTLAAMTAGYVLSVVIGTPKAINASRLISLLCSHIAPWFGSKYQDSEEGQHTAGIFFLITLLIITLVPTAVILILLYHYVPLLAILVDGLICWSVMDIKGVKQLAIAAARSARNKNIRGAVRAAERLTGEELYFIEDEGDMEAVIKATVKGIGDRTVDNAAAPLMYMVLLSGWGGLLFRVADEGSRAYGTESFLEPVTALRDVLCFLPGKLASVIMLVDALFLRMDTRAAEKSWRRAGGKCNRAAFAGCRGVLAGALGISLLPEEVFNEDFVRTYTIGEQIKEAEPTDISIANQLMIGTAFIIMALFFIVKLTIGVCL